MIRDRLNDKIRRSRKLLQNPYAYLQGEGGYDAISQDREQGVHEVRRLLENQYAYLDGDGGYTEYPGRKRTAGYSGFNHPEQFLKSQRKGGQFSKSQIEGIARKLQIEMWHRREKIRPGRLANPHDILDPSSALEGIGYSVVMEESLGQYADKGGLFEVAGILDNQNGRVHVSAFFAPEVRKFTLAHELGHAVLHGQQGLHRDRAVDGATNKVRDRKELEADVFATFFLLPEKLVRAVFAQTFLTHKFVLDDGTAFALTSGSLESIQKKCGTLRDLTRMLANANYFNGVPFHSIAKRFGVSVEAMAIRLEELSLVEWCP